MNSLQRLSDSLIRLATPAHRLSIHYEADRLEIRHLEGNGTDAEGAIVSVEWLDPTDDETQLEDGRIEAWVAAFLDVRLQQIDQIAAHYLSSAWPLLRSSVPVEQFVLGITDDALIRALMETQDASLWDGLDDIGRATLAAEMGNFVLLEQQLSANPSLTNATDDAGFSLLHRTVERCDEFSVGGHIRCITLLLAHGANIQATTEDGTTPLHIARAGVVALLVANGAQLEATNNEGMTPLIVWSTLGEGREVLCELLAAGADRKARDVNGLTALDHARELDDPDYIELLS